MFGFFKKKSETDSHANMQAAVSYEGHWVAYDTKTRDACAIANSPDAAVDEARTKGIPHPFVTYIPRRDEAELLAP